MPMADDQAANRVRPVNWGDLRRLTPVSETWGLDRGGPLDRYYIDNFLQRNRQDISGRVLEVKDPGYTKQYGAGVTRSDVLDINPTNARATIVADLTSADGIPSETFDCFVLTQTLHQIFDIRSALRHTFRILKPGGVLLCTLPSVSRIDSHYEGGGFDESDFWRFTDACIRRLFGQFLPAESFSVEGFGNVMACAAFLYGLSPGELSREELDFVDPWFPLIYCVRAVKPPRIPAASPFDR
jgi:SAM-dependent methyltransferase